MRLFVAVLLDEPVRRRLAQAQDSLRLSNLPIRWVKPESIHLTLKFLGEVSEDRIPSIKTALSGVCPCFSSFEIGMGGIGVFPNITRPRVIWFGINNNPELSALQKEVDKRLEKRGFPGEKRGFKPHLTLGRIRDLIDPGSLSGVIEKAAEEPGITQSVDHFALMESLLSPQGAKYICLEKYFLEEERET